MYSKGLSQNGQSPLISIPIFLRYSLVGILTLMSFHVKNLILGFKLIFKYDKATLPLYGVESDHCSSMWLLIKKFFIKINFDIILPRMSLIGMKNIHEFIHNVFSKSTSQFIGIPCFLWLIK